MDIFRCHNLEVCYWRGILLTVQQQPVKCTIFKIDSLSSDSVYIMKSFDLGRDPVNSTRYWNIFRSLLQYVYAELPAIAQ